MRHLSIDLDFYTYKNKHNFNNMLKMLQRIKKSGLPTIFKEDHHDILEFLNEYKFNEIINVDAHSDIINEERYYNLDCGTWANFYIYRSKCKFTWVHPHNNEHDFNFGRCDDSPKSWNKSKRFFGYDKVSQRHHKSGIITIPKDIHSISVVLSREYWAENTRHLLKDVSHLFEGN